MHLMNTLTAGKPRSIKFPIIVHVPMPKSIKKVMRIKHMITQLEFSSTSRATAIINVWEQGRRICILTLGIPCK